jgi:hypothetical protein
VMTSFVRFFAPTLVVMLLNARTFLAGMPI